MAYEITVITPDGTPVTPRRADAQTVRAALEQAVLDGTRLRIRPVATAAAESGDEAPAPPVGAS